MQILTLLGSPRKHGNTDAVLRRFEASATAMGHVVTRMNVTEYEVAGCLGCDACQVDLQDFGCVQADDTEAILGAIRSADLAVYAAPVYCWSVPAQLKAVIDRHYCAVKWQGGEVATRLLAGKTRRSPAHLRGWSGGQCRSDAAYVQATDGLHWWLAKRHVCAG